MPRIAEHNSAKQYRETSIFKSSIISIQRVSNFITGSHPDRKPSVSPVLLFAPANTMGKSNNKYKKPLIYDWPDRQGGVAGDAGDMADDHGGNGSSSEGKGRTRIERPESLDPFTEAVKKALPDMVNSIEAMQQLTDLCADHITDIEYVPNLRLELEKFKETCKQQEADINNKKSAIRELQNLNDERKDERDREIIDIKEQRKELDEHKNKFEKMKEEAGKRLRAQKAEYELEADKKLDGEKEILRKKLEQQKVQLSVEFEKKGEEALEKMKKLRGENKKLSNEAETQQLQLNEQAERLEELKQELESQIRSRKSFAAENEVLKRELKQRDNEFGLGDLGVESFEKRFQDIASTIDNITAQYFTELDESKADEMHEKLNSTNHPLKFMPITKSCESQKLRVAASQYTISKVLCDVVWQPFSCEQTFLLPGLGSILNDTSTKLDTLDSGTDGRKTSRVWSALSMRGLQLNTIPRSLLADKSSQQARTVHQGMRDYTVNTILDNLLPIDDATKEPHLRADIIKLVDDATTLWQSAQADQLSITLSNKLDPTQRSIWRSLSLDPCLESEPEAEFQSRPRIFTLFPSISAHTSSSPSEARSIHPGSGIPESARWVICAQEEEKGRVEILKEEIENARKRASSRVSKQFIQSRRGSVAGIVAGPVAASSSLTEAWKGKTIVVEKE